MKLVNPKADEKKLQTLQKKRVLFTSIPIVIALIVSVVVICIQVHGFDFFEKAICVVVSIVVGAIAAVIIWVNAYAGKIEGVQSGAELDLSNNIAICDHCGRYFQLNELEWKFNGYTDVKEERGEIRSTTTYMGSFGVSAVCPSCKTKKKTGFSAPMRTVSSQTKNDLWNDKLVTTMTTREMTPDDREGFVNKVYENSKKEAKTKIKQSTDKGYVIDRKSKQ